MRDRCSLTVLNKTVMFKLRIVTIGMCKFLGCGTSLNSKSLWKQFYFWRRSMCPFSKLVNSSSLELQSIKLEILFAGPKSKTFGHPIWLAALSSTEIRTFQLETNIDSSWRHCLEVFQCTPTLHCTQMQNKVNQLIALFVVAIAVLYLAFKYRF